MSTSTGRHRIAVVAAVLQQPDGCFLLAQRPQGKVYAGYWEFPGGKLEAGETVLQALQRELQEELGITTLKAALWRTELVDYPHALVRLNFCKVSKWRGELQMREAQQFAWQRLPVQCVPVLPGTVPVLTWLALERGFTDATHSVA